MKAAPFLHLSILKKGMIFLLTKIFLLGVFPSVASELGKTLDSVLFEIDSSATGDLQTLQSSTFDNSREFFCKITDTVLIRF